MRRKDKNVKQRELIVNRTLGTRFLLDFQQVFFFFAASSTVDGARVRVIVVVNHSIAYFHCL